MPLPMISVRILPAPAYAPRCNPVGVPPRHTTTPTLQIGQQRMTTTTEAGDGRGPVTMPEDIANSWAGAAAHLAQALALASDGSISRVDLMRAALPYVRASMALMERLEAIADAELREWDQHKPRLQLVR